MSVEKRHFLCKNEFLKERKHYQNTKSKLLKPFRDTIIYIYKDCLLKVENMADTSSVAPSIGSRGKHNV